MKHRPEDEAKALIKSLGTRIGGDLEVKAKFLKAGRAFMQRLAQDVGGKASVNEGGPAVSGEVYLKDPGRFVAWVQEDLSSPGSALFIVRGQNVMLPNHEVRIRPKSDPARIFLLVHVEVLDACREQIEYQKRSK